MNIKIIINSVIIIFILHIILLNINYHYVIGKKTHEKFTDNIDSSINFLLNDKNNDEFKEKISKYIQQNETKEKETEFENKNINKVSPANSFLTNDNQPNFESNVIDISKFYNINYDNLNEDQLKSTSEKRTTPIEKLNENIYINKNVSETSHEGRDSTPLPDSWTYKNELPMNGGIMNGIVGFDSLESQFAIYNPNKLNLQTSNDNNYNNIAHDDLRKPIVYEN